MELNEIKGIGQKRAQALNSTGIFTPSDLLLRFPEKYIFTDGVLRGDERDGQEVSFAATVTAEAKRRFIRRGLTVVTLGVECNGRKTICNFFNQPFAARSLKIGDRVCVCGKVKRFKTTVQITNPTIITPRDGDGSIIPVYKTTVPSRTFSAAVKTALENVNILSYIPREVAQKNGLLPLHIALWGVHFPRTREELDRARRSVAIENLCYVVTSYKLLKDDKRDFTYGAQNSAADDFIKNLPYEPTPDQYAAIIAIIEQMRSDKLMNLLVQGEVGCGKTAVALAAMYFAAASGYQSALMSPTETLARQHYQTMVKLLEPLGVRPQLLCASMNKTQKETALFNIKYGLAQCIVGTQSLISDDIEYNNLKLVIVDEQQRFGVNQRAKLEAKGQKTDIMVMSATPIPRTLALSLYGELKPIEIRTMPKNRPEVHTSIVPAAKIKAMYEYISNKAKLDERTFIICPRISDTDDELNGVEKVFGELKNSPLASVCGCIHGKMRENEKNSVMEDFRNGKIKVLVSTTVVEVGIDVPQATTVVVYDADRYGLSQLHQIRGRVGRGTKTSYCFLLFDEDVAYEARERLKTFCGMKDGFSVSELDFKLRGAGDFVGLKQHGNGSMQIDEEIIEYARRISEEVISDGQIVESIKQSLKNPEFIKSVTMN